MKKHWKLGILGLLIGAIVVGYLILPKGQAVPVLPVPNGYDDLLKAAQLVVSDGRRSYDDATDAEIADLVTRNRSAIELARIGCERDCRVALEPNRNYWINHGNVQNRFKLVARVFLAEGLLAERDGRTNDAAHSYLDGIRFARCSSRGGCIVDRLIGMNCENFVADRLGGLVQMLDARTCREFCKVLEALDADTEPWEATSQRNRIYLRTISTPRERIIDWVADLERRRKGQPRRDTPRKQHADEGSLRLRYLIVHLAKRAYRLENGKTARQATQLVPSYLRAIPKDPFSQKEISLD